MHDKLRRGADALLKKLAPCRVDELMQLKRKSACKGGLWERFFG